MGALTDNTPKPMLEVGGKTVLAHVLNSIPKSIDRVFIVVGYLNEAIRNSEFFDEHDFEISFCEQHELNGTYDALCRVSDSLTDGPFLVLNGDDLYSKKDLNKLIDSNPFAMLAKKVKYPNKNSHLKTDPENGLSSIVANKDLKDLDQTLTYTGACLLDKRIFSLEPTKIPGGELSLPHTIEKNLSSVGTKVVEADFWMPVGTPEELVKAEAVVKGLTEQS